MKGRGKGGRAPRRKGIPWRQEGEVEESGETGSLRDERRPPGGQSPRPPRSASRAPPRTGTAPGLPGARGAARPAGSEQRRRRPLALGERK